AETKNMNPENSFVEILHTLYQTESYKKLVVLRHFQSSLRSFNDDYNDLVQVSLLINDSAFLKQIMPVDKLASRQDYFSIVTRFFLHFTHSSQSLADHCRILYRRYYEQDGIFTDYQIKIENTFQDPLSQFMKRLRHFCAHIEIPKLILNSKWTKETGFVTKMIIDKEHLQNHCKDWTAKARDFMSITEEIEVHSLITDYYKKVTLFYSWFFQRLEEIHKVDLDYVNNQETLARRTYGIYLDKNLVSVAEQIKKGEINSEAIFGIIPFDNIEISEITKSHTDPEERINAFLKFAEENYGNLTSDSKEKIRKIYTASATSHNSN
ncbi:hypothetical protein ND856_19050, partial [Leptospira bandrabouensis]|uniref:hypothetical protein n=1 Tax=Leptospira bandrabouensis TaxID=2484903 RepID=UPI00223D9614